MQNKDWLETGEEILKSVVSAVENQDYTGLSKNIEDKINTTIDHINAKIEEGRVHYEQKQMKSSTYQGHSNTHTGDYAYSSQIPRASQQTQNAKPRNVVPNQKLVPQLYAKNPPGTYAGPVCKVLGIVGTSLTGIATFVLGIISLASGSAGVALATAITGGALAGSVATLSHGVKLENRVERFKKYVSRIGHNQYCELEQLAGLVGKKVSFVEKEVRKMIDKRYFLQGHMDDKGTTLITSDFMYKQYLNAEQSRKVREIETAKREALLLEEKNKEYPAEVKKILDEGNQYIKHIRESNDAIPGEVMSQKLDALEDIMTRIFDQLKKNPNSAADLQKMMKYYLPTTKKLVDAYRDLDGQPSYGENNVANTKKEIEDTMDVINDAFGKIFDDMFEDAAWDISTEISTMKTILAKDGLTGERDFQLNKNS